MTILQEAIVFDIEADGLQATRLHCLSATIGGGIRSTIKYGAMAEFLKGAKVLVGHNIARYDIPTLERLLKVEVRDVLLVDTLALSWYLSPERNLHGLESYGEDYNIPKLAIDDWENLSSDEYIARCKRDVEINKRLWDDQFNLLMQVYEDEEEVLRFIQYLSSKMDCSAEQEKSRWKLDVVKCQEGRDTLAAEFDGKVAELSKAMPKVPVVTKKTRPKKPFKQDGSHSVVGAAWFSLLKERGLPTSYNDVIEVVTGWNEGNPNSPPQVKDWLFSLGWRPDEFKYVRDETKPKGVRAIPQINKQAPGEVGVCESVKLLFEKEPAVELLDGLSVISHRLSILNGFLSNVDEEGWIKAEIQGLTNTLRFKHKVVVNLPGVDKPYGELVRGCLTAPEGYELCGSDMSSLEDRAKQHFLWEWDPEFVKEMMADDYDPHTSLAVFAKVITAADEAGFKRKEEPSYSLVKAIRRTYKATNYAAQYGAGPPRIALTANISTREAKELHSTYWRRNWSIKKVAEACFVKTVRGQQWLFNPVSKFYYSLRHEKDRFSTLCQGTGVYCFDRWVEKFRSKRPQLTGQMHDEVILCVKVGLRDEITALLKWAIDEVNKELQLNRELDVDVQFGNNYAEIH